jgi:hypothetical protein
VPIYQQKIASEKDCKMKIEKARPKFIHCKGIIGRNPKEAKANTVAIQLLGNPVPYIRKCFTLY